MPESKRVEGKLYFENERGLQKNLILGTYRFLAKNNAQTLEIPKSMQLDKELFLQRHNEPESWNLKYEDQGNHLQISLSSEYFDMSMSFDGKEPWQTEEPARQPIDLADILNPSIRWKFPSPHPDMICAYWFKKHTPDEQSLLFLGFTERKADYNAIEWLTESMAEHFKTENKKVRGEISLDGKVMKTIS